MHLRSFATLLLVSSLGLGACVDTSTPLDLEFEQPSAKADEPSRPFGTYRRTLAPRATGLAMLALGEDRTYEATFKVEGTCGGGACTESLSGKFRFASSQGNSYIVIYDEGEVLQSFEYKREASKLKLRDTDGDTWLTLTRDASVAANLVLDEGDDGAHREVVEGGKVIVRLPRGGGGYNWFVTSTDRSFGYPESTYQANNPEATGGSGVTTLTWQTTGALPLVGDHAVKLAYRRGWQTADAPLRTFEFTVSVTAP